MNIYEEYKSKLRTPEEAVKVVKDGDWVDYSQTCSPSCWTPHWLPVRRS